MSSNTFEGFVSKLRGKRLSWDNERKDVVCDSYLDFVLSLAASLLLSSAWSCYAAVLLRCLLLGGLFVTSVLSRWLLQ